MDTKALELCSRFAYSPNKLGYCGLESANRVFARCVVKSDCEKVAGEIEHFKGLYPYLKTIGDVIGKDMYSYEVAEAYWLGNGLLNKFEVEDYDVLVENLRAQKLPDFFIDEVRKNKPKKFVPFHLFNVLHIGVGKITGSVPFNLNTINNCMVRWGEVVEIDKKTREAEVKLCSLRKDEDEFKLTKKKERVECNFDFVPRLKTGLVVAVHWNNLCKILTDEEEGKLTYWTGVVLNSVN